MRGQFLNVWLFGAWCKICNDDVRMSLRGPLPSGQCTSSWCVVSNSPLILIPVVVQLAEQDHMVFCPWHNISPLSLSPYKNWETRPVFGNCAQDQSFNKKWETEGVCSNVPEKAVATKD